MPVNMPRGGAATASTVANAALFAEVYQGDDDFFDLLTEPPQTEGMVRKMLKEGIDFEMRSSAKYPVVRITDLQNQAGDKVSVDLVHNRVIKPIMGDEHIKGRRGTSSFSSHELAINQFVFPWSGGGRMAQKRTKWKLTELGMAQMTGHARNYLRQLRLVHMAGARGQDAADDWIVPLETDPDYSGICINPVLAPTYNRHMYAGGAASIDEMDTTCFLKLDDISRLKLFAMSETRNPIRPVITPKDPAAQTSPMGLLLVDDRVWHWLSTYHSGTGNDWRTFQAQARERAPGNPLFTGECGMWNGVLVRKMPRAIRFGQGTNVTVATSAATYTETTVEVPEFSAGGAALDYAISRSIFLGGQALAELWGRNGDTGVPTDLYQGYENDGREPVMSLGGIAGIGKLRFAGSDGVDTDLSVAIIDSYAPSPLKVSSLT